MLWRMKCEELLTYLGGRIRTVRKAKRITQERLAELADLNLSYLSEVERGQANVSLCVANQIANALGVGVAELLEKPPGDGATVDFLALRQKVESLDAYEQVLFMETANGILNGLSKAAGKSPHN